MNVGKIDPSVPAGRLGAVVAVSASAWLVLTLSEIWRFAAEEHAAEMAR
jgi:hypothetical protein